MKLKVQRPNVPLSKPFFNQEEVRQLRDVLESGWVSKGPKARQLEEMVEHYLGVSNAIAVTNCTSALHLALLALDVRFGDVVPIPDYTFPATGFAVKYCQASPLLVDVHPRTYNVDPYKLEAAFSRYSPKVAIVVHTFGQVANMTEIMRIANKHGVQIIEDAACALGADHMGIKAGVFGRVGCFSLHARKGITTGEGGIVVTDDKKLADKIRKLSEFGVQSTWTREQNYFSLPSFEELGYNYKMSDIQAAVGVGQMLKINELIARRRHAAQKYAEEVLPEIPFLEPPLEYKTGKHIYQSYVALVKPDFKHLRKEIMGWFTEEGIQTNIGTYALHMQPIFRGNYFEELPVATDLMERAIALPMFSSVSRSFDRIITGGKRVWQKVLISPRPSSLSGRRKARPSRASSTSR